MNILDYFVESDAIQGDFLINGKWYTPLFGCDTIQHILDESVPVADLKEKFIKEKCVKNIAGGPVLACTSADWVYDFFEPYIESIPAVPKIADIDKEYLQALLDSEFVTNNFTKKALKRAINNLDIRQDAVQPMQTAGQYTPKIENIWEIKEITLSNTKIKIVADITVPNDEIWFVDTDGHT